MELYMLVDADDGIAEVGSYEKCKRLYDRWKGDWEEEWANLDIDDFSVGTKLAIVKVVKGYQWTEDSNGIAEEGEVDYD